MSLTRRLTALHGAFYLSLGLIGFSIGRAMVLDLFELDMLHAILHLGAGAALIGMAVMMQSSITVANRVLAMLFASLTMYMLILGDIPTAALYLISMTVCAHMGFVADYEPAPYV